MTLVSPISAGSFRPVLPQPAVPSVQPVSIIRATSASLNQAAPLIVGITLDNIPSIGDGEILIDDLPQAPKTTDKSATWSLTDAAARSYLEAKTLAPDALNIGSEKPGPAD